MREVMRKRSGGEEGMLTKRHVSLVSKAHHLNMRSSQRFAEARL
jgi:hypothetical protein